MSAHAVGQITGKITCNNGELVPLTSLQQAILSKLGKRYDDRSQVVKVLEHWQPRLSASAPHQVGEQMERVWDQERKREHRQKRYQKQEQETKQQHGQEEGWPDVAHIFA
jgi:hypothetical protein